MKIDIVPAKLQIVTLPLLVASDLPYCYYLSANASSLGSNALGIGPFGLARRPSGAREMPRELLRVVVWHQPSSMLRSPDRCGDIMPAARRTARPALVSAVAYRTLRRDARRGGCGGNGVAAAARAGALPR